MLNYHHKKYRYSLSDGFYRINSVPLGKVNVPTCFKIEEVWKKETVTAPYVIRAYKDGKKDGKVFTGLRPAFGSNNWYYGDSNHQKNYLLAEFSSDKSECTIVEFPNFYPHKLEWRADFTLKYISFHQSDLI